MISFLALHALMTAALFQGCAAGNDLFERTKARFDADQTRTISAEAAQGYLSQFRRVVDLCPGNAAGWYYASQAAAILKDPRTTFYRSQADLHGYNPNAATNTAGPVAARPNLNIAMRLVESTEDGVLKEGETFKLVATLTNTTNVAASGVRLKVSGLAAVRDALGDDHFVGDIAGGSSRAFEVSGKIDNVVQDAGTIQLDASDSSGTRSQSAAVRVAVTPTLDINKLPAEATPDPKAFAVVVGISKYRSPQVPSIEFAANDAELMAEYLRVFAGVPRSNIRKLVDETATKTDLEVTFKEWLPQRAGPGSRVFVYFAGHGTPLVGNDGAPYQNLVPFDARPESALSFFRLSDLYASLERLTDASTYVFLDTCFSGDGRSFTPPNTRALIIEGPAQTENVVVFSASKSTEPSNDFLPVRHGLFSYFIFRGLYGEADANKDQSITVQELYSFLSASVPKTALRVVNRTQNPTLTPDLPRLGARAAGVISSVRK